MPYITVVFNVNEELSLLICNYQTNVHVIIHVNIYYLIYMIFPCVILIIHKQKVLLQKFC